MTTSGTTTFNLDLNDLFEEAFERCGREMRTGYDFRTARRSLNILTIEWANRGINFWTIEEGSIPLVTGQSTYNLPADTIDLVEHVIRTGSGTTQSDLTITRISLPTYSSIPNKTATGRPIQVWVNRQSGAKYPVGGQPEGTDPATGIDYPQITIWPTPNDPGSQYTFVYWRLRRIQDAGQGGVTTQDIPFRFIPCLVAGMSYYLSMKYPDTMARTAELKLAYEEQWKYASEEDRDKSAIRFVPRRMFIA
ncbi:MAG: hypothetical protein EBS78_11525 [Altererythrobacter sp.]|jgi:hypothetical protein|nr:hypothetical protein [Altererythrobacter sp.]NBS69938.1 hypothetical protein [bacterium]